MGDRNRRNPKRDLVPKANGTGSRGSSRNTSPTPNSSQRETRSKVTESEDYKLFQDLNSATDDKDLDPFADKITVVKLLRLVINNQEAAKVEVAEIREDVQTLKKENVVLIRRVNQLEEDQARQEQYSRKGVMIMTGVQMPTDETATQLLETVLGNLNALIPPRQSLSCADFVAVHRNGRNYSSTNRPPSITVKFIRYTQKELFFNKQCRLKLKSDLPGVNYFHNLSQYFVKVQDKIKDNEQVKWVRYDGDRRGFTVCLHSGSFLNFVQSYVGFRQMLDQDQDV